MSEARKTFPLVLSESERQMLRDVRVGMGAESDTEAVRTLIRHAALEMAVHANSIDESLALWRARRRAVEKGFDQVQRERDEQAEAYAEYVKTPEFARQEKRIAELEASLHSELAEIKAQLVKNKKEK